MCFGYGCQIDNTLHQWHSNLLLWVFDMLVTFKRWQRFRFITKYEFFVVVLLDWHIVWQSISLHQLSIWLMQLKSIGFMNGRMNSLDFENVFACFFVLFWNWLSKCSFNLNESVERWMHGENEKCCEMKTHFVIQLEWIHRICSWQEVWCKPKNVEIRCCYV